MSNLLSDTVNIFLRLPILEWFPGQLRRLSAYCPTLPTKALCCLLLQISGFGLPVLTDQTWDCQIKWITFRSPKRTHSQDPYQAVTTFIVISDLDLSVDSVYYFPTIPSHILWKLEFLSPQTQNTSSFSITHSISNSPLKLMSSSVFANLPPPPDRHIVILPTETYNLCGSTFHSMLLCTFYAAFRSPVAMIVWFSTYYLQTLVLRL